MWQGLYHYIHMNENPEDLNYRMGTVKACTILHRAAKKAVIPPFANHNFRLPEEVVQYCKFYVPRERREGLTSHYTLVKRKDNEEVVSEDSDAADEDSDDEESDLSEREDHVNLLEISEIEPVSVKPCVSEQG